MNNKNESENNSPAEPNSTKQTTKTIDELPFVAPYNVLTFKSPINWLKLGWRDIKTAPRTSLTYGLLMLLFSYLISFIAYEFGSFYMLLSLLSGFIFFGPILAVGLYSISCQIQMGLKPILGLLQFLLQEAKVFAH